MRVDVGERERPEEDAAATLLDSPLPTVALAAREEVDDPWREDPWSKDFLPYYVQPGMCTKVSWTSEDPTDSMSDLPTAMQWSWGADGKPRGDNIAPSSLTSWMMRVGSPAAGSRQAVAG